MTRKHFRQFADMVARYESGTVGVDQLARDLADILAGTNPAFSRERFMNAALPQRTAA